MVLVPGSRRILAVTRRLEFDMNVIALVTAALDAVAKFFSWRTSENSRDKDKAETLQRANDARETAQKSQREQQKQLDESLKSGKRNDMEGDW